MKKIIKSIAIAMSLFALATNSAFSAQLCPEGVGGQVIGQFRGLGPLGNTGATPLIFCTTAGNTFVNTLSQIIGLLTAIAGIWFIFNLITGAIAWISSGSDKQSLDGAKKKITNSVIGLLITVLSYSIIGIVGFFFGFDLLNIKGLLANLSPSL